MFDIANCAFFRKSTFLNEIQTQSCVAANRDKSDMTCDKYGKLQFVLPCEFACVSSNVICIETLFRISRTVMGSVTINLKAIQDAENEENA